MKNITQDSVVIDGVSSEQHDDDGARQELHAHKDLETVWESLDPIAKEHQTWGCWGLAYVWMAAVLNPAACTFGGAIVSLGLHWYSALLVFGLSNAFMLVVLCLNGAAGTKYGIPYPVFARAMFGYHGAQIAAMTRAVVAIGWLAIVAWCGAQTVYFTWGAIFPSLTRSPRITANLNLVQFILYTLYVGAHMVPLRFGLDKVQRLLKYATFISVAAILGLFMWSLIVVPPSKMIAATNELADAGLASTKMPPLAIWAVAFCSTVSAWSTMSLNIVDLCRYVRTQRQQIIGQTVGFPITFYLILVTGMTVTGAVKAKYGGDNSWDIPRIFSHLSPAVSTWSSFIILLALLNTNIVADVIPPANDIINIWPEKITFKMAAGISLGASFLFCPWYLFASPDNLIMKFIVGYSVVTGSIVAIMIVDYHIVHHRVLDVSGLYTQPASASPYYFNRGFKWEAFVALAVGVGPCVPGFARTLSGASGSGFGFVDYVYAFAWFVAFFHIWVCVLGVDFDYEAKGTTKP